MNLWVIFLTGLTVGGLTCLAVQGGLLASVIASREGEEIKKGVNKKDTVFPTLSFLVAKLIAYVIFGFFLGAFGSVVGISQNTQIIMQFIAGLYMIVIALNLLNVHPFFRYFVIQPPRFLTKRIRNQSKSKDVFAPALLGVMTIFIPCGTTLAMEALAISSANPFLGAAIMGAFVLGTSPLFFGVGWITSVLGDNFRSAFLKVAAVAVLYLGVTSLNGALVASGSSFTFQNGIEGLRSALRPTITDTQGSKAALTQNPTIIISANGYSPSYMKVKKGEPVTVTLKGVDAYSCASAFRVPSLGISKNLLPNETYTFTFTPQSTGPIRFMCSMGMFQGVIDVI